MYSKFEELIKNMQEDKEQVSLFAQYDDTDLDEEYQAYSALLFRLQNDLACRSDYEHRQKVIRKRQKHMDIGLNYCTII